MSNYIQQKFNMVMEGSGLWQENLALYAWNQLGTLYTPSDYQLTWDD